MSDEIPKDGAPQLAEAIVARGNNLVFIAPPAPSAARPVLAGMLARIPGNGQGPCLALAPPAALPEWGRVAGRVADALSRHAASAQTPARLTRLLHTGGVDLILTSPETAYEVVRRAALKLGDLAGLLLLWPESWEDEALSNALIQEVAKEAQRVVVTADPAGSASLIERYCWRAAVTDLLGPEPVDPPPAVRSVPVAWSRRTEVLLDLIEQLDPDSVAVWLNDPGEYAGIQRALAATGTPASVGNATPPAAALVVAYDLPSPLVLRQLAAVGSVVLLTPPGTEGYVARMVPRRRPLHPTGSLEATQRGLARTRRTLAEHLEQGPTAQSYLALAPLLERYEATAVAAVLFELWERAAAGSAESTPPVRPPVASVQLWVGVGKKDAVTPHDLVAILLNECGVPKEAIGKIEIRETFTMLQLGSAVDAAQVAEQLTGKVIRKRRVVARVDKGRPAKGSR